MTRQAPPSLTVSVITPAAPMPAAPPEPVTKAMPEKPVNRPAVRKNPPPVPKPKAPVPIKQKTEPVQPDRPSVPVPPVAPSIPSTAPAAPSTPPAQEPVKTGISVNASYVATETEKWYPSLSKRYGEQGTVVVRVQVSAEGRAERVEVKKRSDYPLLDEAAIGLAKSLKYNPAKVDGKPVADWVDIPITFRLRNS